MTWAKERHFRLRIELKRVSAESYYTAYFSIHIKSRWGLPSAGAAAIFSPAVSTTAGPIFSLPALFVTAFKAKLQLISGLFVCPSTLVPQPNLEYIRELVEVANASPFPEHMAMRLLSIELGRTAIKLKTANCHLQAYGQRMKAPGFIPGVIPTGGRAAAAAEGSTCNTP